MEISAFAEKIFAGRWIAGYYPEDAIKRAKEFNTKNLSVEINFLGEKLSNRKEIEATVNVYINLIGSIKKEELKADVSLKLTQLGFYLDKRLGISNYIKIIKFAKQNGVFVWIDMEEPKYINLAIKTYKKGVKYGNAGICIQAYLKRSSNDVKDLLNNKAIIRLVKGAYKVDKKIGFASKAEVDSNYVNLMKILFKKSNRFVIATHDTRLIDLGKNLNKNNKTKVTYAMLNGIRNNYAVKLAKEGQIISIYLPFGEKWLDFAKRRLIEQEHLPLIIRSLFENQRI